jgi:hypothetical protein
MKEHQLKQLIKEILNEMWKDSLQKNYSSFEEFEAYDRIYGLSKRLGFSSAEEAWEANPMIQGSTNPTDYKKVNRESFGMAHDTVSPQDANTMNKATIKEVNVNDATSIGQFLATIPADVLVKGLLVGISSTVLYRIIKDLVSGIKKK